jgi:hypothetical protein
MTTKQTIQMDAALILGSVKTILPALEAAIPAVAAAGGPIGLGIAAAGGLLTLLGQIEIGGVMTVDEQAALSARITAAMQGGFKKPEWTEPLVKQPTPPLGSAFGVALTPPPLPPGWPVPPTPLANN